MDKGFALLIFNSVQDELFSELVINTIDYIGRKSWPSGSMSERIDSCAGHYVGGQADMGVDQQTHLMLEYVQVTDANNTLQFDLLGLRQHLIGADRFGVDLSWAIESLLRTIREWHPLGWDHPLLSPDPFGLPAEFKDLIVLFERAGYACVMGDEVAWTARMKAIMGVECWGINSKQQPDAWNNVLYMFSQLPPVWRERIRNEKHSSDLMQSLEAVLSNHWYNERWNDDPVRGDRSEVYMRSAMSDVACVMHGMVHGQLEQW